MPNMQETFDTVYQHLVDQGRASVSMGACRYRGPNGKKCAIGRLIPDKLYVEEMEGLSVDLLIRDHKVPSYFKRQVALLRGLQIAHDASTVLFGKRFHDDMKDIAKEFKLKYNKPSKG